MKNQEAKTTNALSIEIGGNHYKSLKRQPIELIARLDVNFMQGNIIKYAVRYKFKNGLEDLQKALHYCDLAEQLSPYRFKRGLDIDYITSWLDDNSECLDRDLYFHIIYNVFFGFYDNAKSFINLLIKDYEDKKTTQE